MFRVSCSQVVVKLFSCYSLLIYADTIKRIFEQFHSMNFHQWTKIFCRSTNFQCFVEHKPKTHVLAGASLLKSFSSRLQALLCLYANVLRKVSKMTRCTHLKIFDYHVPALSASGRCSLSGLLPFWEESRSDLLRSRRLLCWSSCTRQTGMQLKSLEV